MFRKAKSTCKHRFSFTNLACCCNLTYIHSTYIHTYLDEPLQLQSNNLTNFLPFIHSSIHPRENREESEKCSVGTHSPTPSTHQRSIQLDAPTPTHVLSSSLCCNSWQCSGLVSLIENAKASWSRGTCVCVVGLVSCTRGGGRVAGIPRSWNEYFSLLMLLSREDPLRRHPAICQSAGDGGRGRGSRFLLLFRASRNIWLLTRPMTDSMYACMYVANRSRVILTLHISFVSQHKSPYSVYPRLRRFINPELPQRRPSSSYW